MDLCPTMSAFLGLPVPRNNLGRVEVAALPRNAPLEDKVRLLHLNAAQIANILEKNVEDIEEGKHKFEFFFKCSNDVILKVWVFFSVMLFLTKNQSSSQLCGNLG